MERFDLKGNVYPALDHMWRPRSVVQAWETFHIFYGDVLRSYVEPVADIECK